MQFSKAPKPTTKQPEREKRRKIWPLVGTLAAAVIAGVVSLTSDKVKTVLPKPADPADPAARVYDGIENPSHGLPHESEGKAANPQIKNPQTGSPSPFPGAEKPKPLTPLEQIRAQLPPEIQEDWDTLEKYCGDLAAGDYWEDDFNPYLLESHLDYMAGAMNRILAKLNLQRPGMDIPEMDQRIDLFGNLNNWRVIHAICGGTDLYQTALKKYAQAILDSDLNPYEKFKLLERMDKMLRQEDHFSDFFEKELKDAIRGIEGLYVDRLDGKIGYGNSVIGNIKGDHVALPPMQSLSIGGGNSEEYEKYKALLAERAGYFRKTVEKILAFDTSKIETIVDLNELRDLEMLFREIRSMRKSGIGISDWDKKAFEETYGVTEDQFLDAEEKIIVLKIFDVINKFAELETKITSIMLMEEKDPANPNHGQYLLKKLHTHREFAELMAKINDYGLDIIKMQEFGLPSYVTWEYLEQLGQQLEFTPEEKVEWDHLYK